VGIVVVLGAIFLGVSPGCSSLSKEDLEARLVELDKNAGLRELGLQRKQIEVDIRGTAETLELVYVHMPSTSRGVPRTPVFLVHGTPSTMFTWAEIALGGEGFAGLAAERDVYLLEVIGHGLGPSSPGPITFQVCADYVAAAVRSFELEPVFLVGQSYGGEFAWRAAADSPDQFAGLVLMSSSGVERRAGDWLSEEVQMRENSLADFGWLINSPDRVASALEPHFRQIPPDRVDEFFLVCENRSNWQAMIDLAQDENGDREDQLSRLGMPTLLLWGAEDAGYRPDYYARRFHEQIPDSRLVLIPETGHYAHEERPEVVLQYLSEFFASVERRP
jgi:pimeloyl-ACP methyl ester carboxylesterase